MLFLFIAWKIQVLKMSRYYFYETAKFTVLHAVQL